MEKKEMMKIDLNNETVTIADAHSVTNPNTAVTDNHNAYSQPVSAMSEAERQAHLLKQLMDAVDYDALRSGIRETVDKATASLQQEKDDLEARLNSLDVRITSLETQNAALSAQVASLEAEASCIQVRLTSAECSINSIEMKSYA